jgi:carbamoyl-phosphate synthase small subunit
MAYLTDCALVLADGRIFRGRAFGARRPIVVGEVVFNTAMTGYQEILTDPSYCGQLVCMTQPHIGVYGVNDEDIESATRRPQASGLIVRQLSETFSNRRATSSLADYLAVHDIVGITGIDTRALTRHLRDQGAMTGAIASADLPTETVLSRIHDWGTMEGRELVSHVTCRSPYAIPAIGEEKYRIAAYDYGAKQNIFRELALRGATTHVFPATAPTADLLTDNPDGIFLSNGPGDPAVCADAVASVKALLGLRPMMGICLGHQLMALAVGATTYKLPFGHHGANHPVLERGTGRIEITSQNHGFAVDEASLQDVGGSVTHTNLNDHSVEGFALQHLNAFCVQYHPEAAPGPHDAHHLFDRFLGLLRT